MCDFIIFNISHGKMAKREPTERNGDEKAEEEEEEEIH